MTIYDVAIIGGGLAGCSAAIRLAQQGFRIVLCEASRYPHHKVCGEFMSPGCYKHLTELGVGDAVWQHGAVAIDSVLISTPNGVSWQARLPGPGTGISRYCLDDLMAQKAEAYGVDLRANTTVTGIEGSLNNGFLLHTRQRDTLQARVVIGAHGKRSKIDRLLDRSFLGKAQPFIGLKQHMQNVTMPDQVELHTFNGGYCGISRVENGHTNVCLLVREDVFRRHSADGIQQFILWMQSQNNFIAERLSHAEPVLRQWLSIAQVPFISKDVIHNDVFMIGDAAGMITPLTGDGMEIALQSGELISTHLADYFHSNCDAQTLMTKYQDEWNKTFQPRIRLGRLSQFFMFRPSWLQWALASFNTVPSLGDYFIQHTRHIDRQTI